MEFNADTKGISLQSLGEYVVVRHGLGLGIEMHEKNRHPAISQEEFERIKARYDAMPIGPEYLPFEITSLEARLALSGMEKVRAERPEVRERRQDIKFRLKGVLEKNRSVL